MHHLNPQTKDENAFVAQPFVGTEHIGGNTASSPSCPVGADLSATDYAALESRWIDHALANRAGLRRVDSLTGGESSAGGAATTLGSSFLTVTPAPITSATTDCGATIRILNMIPQAI